MALYPNVSVTTTKQLLGINNAPGANIGIGQFAKPGTRQVNVTNNGVGAGTVYVQLVPTGTASTLTTSTYTFAVPSQPNPYEYILTEPQRTSFQTAGFDIWLIGSAAAQVSVQTVPF